MIMEFFLDNSIWKCYLFIFKIFWNFNFFMTCFESLIVLIIMIFWIRNCIMKISLLTTIFEKEFSWEHILTMFPKTCVEFFQCGNASSMKIKIPFSCILLKWIHEHLHVVYLTEPYINEIWWSDLKDYPLCFL